MLLNDKSSNMKGMNSYTLLLFEKYPLSYMKCIMYNEMYNEMYNVSGSDQ